jgi:hypothetical protein
MENAGGVVRIQSSNFLRNTDNTAATKSVTRTDEQGVTKTYNMTVRFPAGASEETKSRMLAKYSSDATKYLVETSVNLGLGRPAGTEPTSGKQKLAINAIQFKKGTDGQYQITKQYVGKDSKTVNLDYYQGQIQKRTDEGKSPDNALKKFGNLSQLDSIFDNASPASNVANPGRATSPLTAVFTPERPDAEQAAAFRTARPTQPNASPQPNVNPPAAPRTPWIGAQSRQPGAAAAARANPPSPPAPAPAPVAAHAPMPPDDGEDLPDFELEISPSVDGIEAPPADHDAGPPPADDGTETPLAGDGVESPPIFTDDEEGVGRDDVAEDYAQDQFLEDIKDAKTNLKPKIDILGLTSRNGLYQTVPCGVKEQNYLLQMYTTKKRIGDGTNVKIEYSVSVPSLGEYKPNTSENPSLFIAPIETVDVGSSPKNLSSVVSSFKLENELKKLTGEQLIGKLFVPIIYGEHEITVVVELDKSVQPLDPNKVNISIINPQGTDAMKDPKYDQIEDRLIDIVRQEFPGTPAVKNQIVQQENYKDSYSGFHTLLNIMDLSQSDVNVFDVVTNGKLKEKNERMKQLGELKTELQRSL